MPSGCLSICVSVTLGYCIKMARRRIMQIMPHDSQETLSFLMPKMMAKFERDHPLRGRQMQVKWVKIGHFRHKTRYNSKTVPDRRIASIIVKDFGTRDEREPAVGSANYDIAARS